MFHPHSLSPNSKRGGGIYSFPSRFRPSSLCLSFMPWDIVANLGGCKAPAIGAGAVWLSLRYAYKVCHLKAPVLAFLGVVVCLYGWVVFSLCALCFGH